MGKRNKDPQVGRRRPMIQLGSARKTVGVVSRNATAEEEASAVEKNVEKTAGADMDDELAGFLAEINSLETPKDVGSTTNGKAALEASTLLYDPTNFDASTQGHLLPEPWEACYDESSGYYYYWNKETNEVQWYPPTVAVPAPPPPPPPPPPTEPEEPHEPSSTVTPPSPKSYIVEDNEIKQDIEEEQKSNNTKKKEDVLDEIITESVISVNLEEENMSANLVGIEDKKKKEEVGTIDKEKEKDKELMSKIKEKIKKKKEEKLLKEKEELNLLRQKQQEKEEMLRETLIQKMKDRNNKKPETSLNTHEILTEVALPIVELETQKLETEETKNLNESKNEENFSLDIFAEETSNKKNMSKKLGFEEQTLTRKEVKEVIVDSESDALESDEKISKVNASQHEEKEVANCEPSLPVESETKGNWRIVDSVYDDEDDETGSDEIDKYDVSSISESSEKSAEEMEDYANMLLEDGIINKEGIKYSNNKQKTSIIPTPPVEAPPLPPVDSQPPLPPEDEPPPALPEMTAEQEEENRMKINELSAEIFEKLDFLGVNMKDMRSLEIYMIEIETRYKDWKCGALNTKYFFKYLNELNEKIIEHEEKAAPPGWACHWSSDFKMYYYYNNLTGDSQWEYPTDIAQGLEAPPVEASPNAVEHAVINKSLVSPAHGFSREPVQTNTKVKKKKRPVGDSSPQIQDPYRDPYRQAKRTKPDASEENTASGDDSGTASPLPASVIAAAPQIMCTREMGPAAAASSSLPQEDILMGKSFLLSKSDKTSLSSSLETSKLKAKIKKKKAETASMLPNKKLKHVSSLVQKWKTVKQQVEEEENVELESEEEDFEQASERRIEEWKREVEATGEKEFNPNFMEIKSDWRERLLKRKT